jgi:type VI secretion system protein ImpK
MATNTFTKTIISQTMDINLSKGGLKTENLSTLCTDIFLIVIKMRDAEDLGETSALRKLIMYYLKQFEKNCSIIGVPAETVNSVKYALIAILDETVLSIPSEARNFWITNPMQLEIYGDNIAGQEFYNKLDTMLNNPDTNRDALEVFYLCLSLGYMGKYILGNAEEREEIITKLARTLVKAGNLQIDTLSPHALRMTLLKKAQGVKKNTFIPLWFTGSFMVVLIVIAWITISVISDSNASAIASMVGR